MTDGRRAARWLVLGGVSLSLLTACTVSVSGGLLGAVASIGAAVALLLLAGATQTGCAEDPPTRDDAEVSDIDVGPCLRDIYPVSDLRIPDMRPRDVSVMPCLGPNLVDATVSADAAPDLSVGPCLEPPPEPNPVPMGSSDAGLDAAPDAGPDARIGPCLDTPPDPEPPDGKAMRAIDRDAIFTRVAMSLPPDIAARLIHRDDEI